MPKKILVILGGGGHTVQMLRLVEKLGNNFIYGYVVGYDDQLSEKGIKIKGEIYHIYDLRDKKDKSLILVGFKLVPSLLSSFFVLRKSKPNMIVGCGPGLCIPIIFLAKFFGVKTIFIESWVRSKKKSITGKILYYFSDLFFVQWPDLRRIYKRAIFAGRLG